MPSSSSPSPVLTFFALAIATIFIAMGFNAMFRPRSGLAVFEFPLPSARSTTPLSTDLEWEKLVDNLMVIYGVRDVFMGAVMFAVSWCGTKRALGWVLVAASAVAFTDGVVSIWQIGGGQWNHWGYAPGVAVVGALLVAR